MTQSQFHNGWRRFMRKQYFHQQSYQLRPRKLRDTPPPTSTTKNKQSKPVEKQTGSELIFLSFVFSAAHVCVCVCVLYVMCTTNASTQSVQVPHNNTTKTNKKVNVMPNCKMNEYEESARRWIVICLLFQGKICLVLSSVPANNTNSQHKPCVEWKYLQKGTYFSFIYAKQIHILRQWHELFSVSRGAFLTYT